MLETFYYLFLISLPLFFYEIAERIGCILVSKVAEVDQFTEYKNIVNLFPLLKSANYWFKHLKWHDLLRSLRSHEEEGNMLLYKRILFLFYFRKVCMAFLVLELAYILILS